VAVDVEQLAQTVIHAHGGIARRPIQDGASVREDAALGDRAHSGDTAVIFIAKQTEALDARLRHGFVGYLSNS
jgi:hypothetical protein